MLKQMQGPAPSLRGAPSRSWGIEGSGDTGAVQAVAGKEEHQGAK